MVMLLVNIEPILTASYALTMVFLTVFTPKVQHE